MGGKGEIIYQKIKRMIVEGALAPLSALSEDAFKIQFSCSRTPVREALQQLEKEGLVYIYPQKGSFVSAISVEVLRQVYELRLLVEPVLVRKACSVLPADKIAEMEARIQNAPAEMGTDAYRSYWNNFDYDFHNLILTATDNQFLRAAMSQAYVHNHRARLAASAHDWEPFEQSRKEHLALLHALKEQNEDLAQRVIEQHLREGSQNFSRQGFCL